MVQAGLALAEKIWKILSGTTHIISSAAHPMHVPDKCDIIQKGSNQAFLLNKIYYQEALSYAEIIYQAQKKKSENQ